MEFVILAAWAEIRLMYDCLSSVSVSLILPSTGSIRLVQDKNPGRFVTICVIELLGNWYLPNS